MDGTAWAAQPPCSSGLAVLDEAAMPFAGAEGTICVVGEPSTSEYVVVRRYREDLDDPPHGRINVDTFRLWNGVLPPQLEPNRIATAASTSYNANCQTYVKEWAFIEPQAHGADHWLPTLPPDVRILIARKSQ
jgi:hypothetical protein